MAATTTTRRLAVAALAAGACGGEPPPTAPEPRVGDRLVVAALGGLWDWRYQRDEPGLHRIERERWQLTPTAGAGSVRGGYLREVEVTATDGVPFTCNQQTTYTQRAYFDVRATVVAGTAVIEETGYRVEPSPCDHGFRRLGHYLAQVRPTFLTLRWDGGQETLRRIGPRPELLAPPLFAGDVPVWNGPWRWSSRTLTEAGDVRDEREEWEVAVGARGAGATYVRTVTVSSGDGRVLPCAGQRSWTYVDRYVLDGRIEGDELALREIAAAPDHHPCLTEAPRALDQLSAHLDGAFLDVTWRGKRRQVLHRP